MTEYEYEIEDLKLMLSEAHSLVRRVETGKAHSDLPRLKRREQALRDAVEAMEERNAGHIREKPKHTICQ